MNTKRTLCYLILLITLACKSELKENSVTQHQNILKLTQHLTLIETNDDVIINPNKENVIFKKTNLPLQSVMVIPSSVIGYFDTLGEVKKITGVVDANYIYNTSIHKNIEQKNIQSVGTANELFIEKILNQKPDLIISTSNPVLSKYHEQLKKEGLKIIYIDEYLEATPLAKSEYLILFGVLLGKKNKAINLFNVIQKNYNSIQEKVKTHNQPKPTVLANGMYGDVWFMPGGKSFQAKFIQDAGGDYLWKNDDHKNVLNLSFEEVAQQGLNANVWINVADFKNKESLQNSYPNYSWFKAYKNNKVYNWYKRSNAQGANDYFETGTVRSDLVLKDLAAIFYPDLFPQHSLYFYERLK